MMVTERLSGSAEGSEHVLVSCGDEAALSGAQRRFSGLLRQCNGRNHLPGLALFDLLVPDRHGHAARVDAVLFTPWHAAVVEIKGFTEPQSGQLRTPYNDTWTVDGEPAALHTLNGQTPLRAVQDDLAAVRDCLHDSGLAPGKLHGLVALLPASHAKLTVDKQRNLPQGTEVRVMDLESLRDFLHGLSAGERAPSWDIDQLRVACRALGAGRLLPEVTALYREGFPELMSPRPTIPEPPPVSPPEPPGEPWAEAPAGPERIEPPATLPAVVPAAEPAPQRPWTPEPTVIEPAPAEPAPAEPATPEPRAAPEDPAESTNEVPAIDEPIEWFEDGKPPRSRLRWFPALIALVIAVLVGYGLVTVVHNAFSGNEVLSSQGRSFTLADQAEDSDCAEHASGAARGMLAGQSCSGLNRQVLTTSTGADGQEAAVATARVVLSDPRAAAELGRILQDPAEGGITSLISDGDSDVTARFTGAHRVSEVRGNEVRIAEAAPLEGNSVPEGTLRSWADAATDIA